MQQYVFPSAPPKKNWVIYLYSNQITRTKRHPLYQFNFFTISFSKPHPRKFAVYTGTDKWRNVHPTGPISSFVSPCVRCPPRRDESRGSDIGRSGGLHGGRWGVVRMFGRFGSTSDCSYLSRHVGSPSSISYSSFIVPLLLAPFLTPCQSCFDKTLDNGIDWSFFFLHFQK